MGRYIIALVFAALGIAPALAQQQGIPDFYVGANAGQSSIRNDFYDFNQHDFGFSVTAGIRPIPQVGAEVSYVNLGDSQYDYPGCFTYCGGSRARSQGGAAFGVFYLPIPSTIAEVYGKAGIARLDTHESGVYGCPGYGCGYYGENDRTDTGFAWAGGVQLNWWNFSFRAEYEQFQSQLGRPSLVSAGAFWHFW